MNRKNITDMGFYQKLVIFLLLNIAALLIGGFLQGEGARSEWYRGLEIAPWTPPGWVFGAAWFTIMICFSFYMAYATELKQLNLLIILFIIQWVLNVSWNAVFFRFHLPFTGLIVIILLTVLVVWFFFYGLKQMPLKSLLVLPYLIWLLLATSLNAFIWLRN